LPITATESAGVVYDVRRWAPTSFQNGGGDNFGVVGVVDAVEFPVSVENHVR
jgi:hypothetical protein